MQHLLDATVRLIIMIIPFHDRDIIAYVADTGHQYRFVPADAEQSTIVGPPIHHTALLHTAPCEVHAQPCKGINQKAQHHWQ